MKILIIYTYPHHKSLNGNILDSFQQNISSKHTVRIIDFYQENFNPALYFDKEHRRRDLQYSDETKSTEKQLLGVTILFSFFPSGGMECQLY
jgi:NAD(P)H dehydrogenase (quinone)